MSSMNFIFWGTSFNLTYMITMKSILSEASNFLLIFYEFHEMHFFITSLEGSFSSSFFSSRFSRPLLGPPTNWSLQRNAKKDTLNKSQRRQNV